MLQKYWCCVVQKYTENNGIAGTFFLTTFALAVEF